VGFTVVKNTLAVKASRALEFSTLEQHFKGPTALAVSTGDPTSPARVLHDFRKEHEDKPHVKVGFVEGRVLDAEEVKALASLPTRDQLISQVMQLALAPAQNLVYALNDSLSKLVRTVDAVRDGMEKGTIAAGGTGGAEAPAPAPEAAAEEAPEEAAEGDTPAAEEKPAEEGGGEAESAPDSEEKKPE
jgi:large subunit ribosomal protein L10